MQTNEVFDVIVLGTGIGGLASALAAAERGLNTLLIEKKNEIGGTTTESYGILWVGCNHLYSGNGDLDNRDEVIAYMNFIAGGEASPAHLQAYVDRAPAALKFFHDCGIDFGLVRGFPDHYFGIAPGARADGRCLQTDLISARELGEWCDKVRKPDWEPYCVTVEEQIEWGGVSCISEWDQALMHQRQEKDMRGKGVGLVCHFLKRLLERKVPIRTGEVVRRLLLHNNRVTGVETESGAVLAARKGVVLATGGYGSNPAMVTAFEGYLPDWRSSFPASNDGDGFVLSGELGAAVHFFRNNLETHLCIDAPPDESGRKKIPRNASVVELCSPHTMLVNRAGQRYADEVFFQDVTAASRHFDISTHDYINLPTYLIFDSQYAEKHSFLDRPTSAPIPDWVARDNTLRGLAKKLEIDPAGLAKTVRRFNQFVEEGRDRDFHRGERAWRTSKESKVTKQNPTLGSLSDPPYYGLQLYPTVGSSVGILTNEHAEVIHQRRRPIEGLFAVGMTSAKLAFGAGYQAGFHLASAMTFGYLAVERMLSRDRH